MRILLVSTARPESAYLHKALLESTHSLQVTNDVRDAMFLASQDAFDAILIVVANQAQMDDLHVSLPAFAGLANSPSTILMLGQAAPGERARMLRAGADACFVQPYSIIEIQERLSALRRTIHHGRAVPARNSPARLDALTHEFVEAAQRLAVTKREYLVIECLLRHANSPVARDHLIRYAWAEADDVDPASVNVVISRLRRKMQQHGFTSQIETVNHFGYRLGLNER
jgi:two-component system OmpR family response regulator